MAGFLSSLVLSASLVSASWWDPTLTAASSIHSVQYAGSGCLAGAAHPAPGSTSMTVIYDNFNPSSGPGTTAASLSQTCTNTFSVLAPQGLAGTLQSYQFRGFAALDVGVTATVKVTYNFAEPGVSGGQPGNYVIHGPYNDDWSLFQNISKVDFDYWLCRQPTAPLSVAVKIYLSGNTSSLATGSSISLDSFDVGLSAEAQQEIPACVFGTWL